VVRFLLASREESGAPVDVYSPRSPLGAAIMGKKVGEEATYTLPHDHGRDRGRRPVHQSMSAPLPPCSGVP
jgi:Transcription elongation factor, GreA/GreB, C-term